MKTMRKWLSLTLACVLLLSACGGGTASQGGPNVSSDSSGAAPVSTASPSERKLKDSLMVAIVAEPSDLDPNTSTNLVCRQIERQIFNTLVDRTNDGTIVPELAEKWEKTDESTIRFYLRKGVKFHNGEELKADDVKFTLERLTSHGPNVSMYAAFDMENSKVVDDYTIDVKMKEPFAGVYNFLAAEYAGIQCKNYVEKVGDAAVLRSPIGTGPFSFKEWKSGESIELARNENYWKDQKPSFSKLTFKFIAEPSTRTIELETGGSDIIYRVAISDLNRLRDNKDVTLVVGSGRPYTYMTINMTDPKFADPRVREALACSLDMKSIVDTVYGDMATVADSIMNPMIAGYKSMGVIPYNPDKARELLKEAGVDKLDVTLKMNSDNSFIAVSEIVQNMWRAVGINAELQVLEMAAYTAQGGRGEVQLGISSYGTASGDPDQALQTWKSTYKGQMQCNDPKIDKLLLTARGEYDPQKRIEDYGNAIDYMWNTHYMIPIAFNNLAFATRSNVENLLIDAGEYPDLSGVVIYEE